MKATTLALASLLFAAQHSASLAQQTGPSTAAHAVSTGSVATGEKGSLFRHATIDEAWAAAQRHRRPMLIYVVSDHCLYCKKMVAETLSNPQVVAGILSTAEPVALNGSEHPQLAKKLGVRAYPTTLLVSPDNRLLYQAVGFKPADEFATELWPILREASGSRQAKLVPVTMEPREPLATVPRPGVGRTY